ncbi:MAG TPA: YbjN domain-containing protein [Candidatus Hydrogenedentes bacterium]|nr:YbjN domain-containing protein [Candidatus Hydrogenedentota bacterium]
MGIFSAMFSESKEDKIARWKKDILELLKTLPEEEDVAVDIDDTGKIVAQKGSAMTFVSFITEEDNDIYLMVWSPLVYLPKENFVAFYRYLLDRNNEMICPARLVTDGDVVELEAVFDTDFLSDDVIRYLVLMVLNAADILDDELVNEFGVKRWTDD